MSFQIPTTTTAAAPNFNFGVPTTATAGLAAKPPTFGSLGGGDAGAGNKPIAFNAPTMQPAGTTPTTGLTFGAPPASQASGMTFGAPPASQAPGMTFGAPPASQATGLTFGTAAPTPAAGLSFGAPATSQATGLTFGAPPASQATGLTFGAPPASQATGLSFGAPATSQATGLTFGAAASTPATGLTFGAPATSQATGLTFGAAASTPATGLSFGAPKTTQSTGLPGFGAPTTTTPATAATTQSSFNFGTSTANPVTTTATGLSTMLSMPKSTTAIPTTAATNNNNTFSNTGGGGAGFANLSTATKTTDSSQVGTTNQISYHQLEEHINKWTLELEEQEKVFTDQATQINAWDKVLIGNNQKIVELNDAVQKVKADQQTLEQELEFISTQHKELEDSLLPLHNEFINIPPTDMERSMTYMLVENLDTQLKQMSEDLKEIIDNLNEANKGQDNTDPIIQIGKILNAHMSSLQWIETSSTNICNKLEDLSNIQENFKRESERSFRSTYYN